MRHWAVSGKQDSLEATWSVVIHRCCWTCFPDHQSHLPSPCVLRSDWVVLIHGMMQTMFESVVDGTRCALQGRNSALVLPQPTLTSNGNCPTCPNIRLAKERKTSSMQLCWSVWEYCNDSKTSKTMWQADMSLLCFIHAVHLTWMFAGLACI